jgi:site-specific DNA recombinase
VPSDPARLFSCAVYTRQSVKTESDLTSCDVQRDLCAEFLQRQRLQGLRLKLLNERFDDEGVSGASLDRPALQRLLVLVRTKKVDAVVVHRLDRLSRRVLDCAALLEEFKQLGARLFVASMPDLTGGAYDTLLLNLLSPFAGLNGR